MRGVDRPDTRVIRILDLHLGAEQPQARVIIPVDGGVEIEGKEPLVIRVGLAYLVVVPVGAVAEKFHLRPFQRLETHTRLHAVGVEIAELPADDEVAVLLGTTAVNQNGKRQVDSAADQVQRSRGVGYRRSGYGTQIDRDTFADRAAGKRERLGIDRSRDIRRQPFKRDRYRTCYARVADHPIVARDAAARALRITTGKVDIRRSEYAQLRCGFDNNCMAARRRPGAGGRRSGKDDQPRFRRRTGIRLQTQGDARAERGIGIDASGYARRQLAERKPDSAARSADTHDGDGNIRRRTPLDQRLTQRTCKKEIRLSAGCLLESNVAHGNSRQQRGVIDRLEHHRGNSRLGDGKIEGRVKTSPCRHVRDCRRYRHAASVQSRQAQVLLDSDACNRQQANMQAYAALQCGKCDPRPTAAKLAAGRIVETGDMPGRRVDHDSTNDSAIFQERYARQLIIESGAYPGSPIKSSVMMYLPLNRKSARPDQFKIRGRNIRIPFPRRCALGASVFAVARMRMPFQAG